MSFNPTITIPYEKVYVPRGLPILLMDYRVYVWRIVHKYEVMCEGAFADVADNFLRGIFASFFHDMIPELDSKYHLVICNDKKSEQHAYEGDNGDKNYWRNSILREHSLPEYKGSRGGDQVKPEFYEKVYQMGLNYAKELGVPVFEQEGFEADDFIAQFVRYGAFFDTGRDIIICSIDSDLMQLVTEGEPESSRVLFYTCNNFGHTSKLRGEVEVLEYCLKMYGKQFASPREIVDEKVMNGDASDCLLSGSPRGIIDLHSPLQSPLFDKRIFFSIREGVQNVSQETAMKAKKYLKNFPINS